MSGSQAGQAPLTPGEQQGMQSAAFLGKSFEGLGLFLRGALATPLTNITGLIQMGYEPKGEWPSKNFLGWAGYRRQGVIPYGRFLYSQHGLSGIYSGFACRGLESLVSGVVREKAREVLWAGYEPAPRESLSWADASKEYAREVVVDSICGCSAVVISQPFYMLGIRMAGQLVGGETKYTGLVQGFRTIFNEEGAAGFFTAVVPACVGEVVYVASMGLLTRLIGYVYTKYYKDTLPPIDKDTADNFEKLIIHSVASLFATNLFYPLFLARAVMSVNDCGLACGCAPFAPKYNSFVDALTDIRAQGGLSPRGLLRGTSNWRRFYSKPISPAKYP